MKFRTAFYFFGLLVFTLFISCFASKDSQSFKKDIGVKVLSDTFNIDNQIPLLLNGTLGATGECNPTIQLGLLKLDAENNWDTIVNINNLGVLMCGLDRNNWANDTAFVLLNDYRFIAALKNQFDYSGTYCFTYLLYKKKKIQIINTNAFTLVL